MLRNMLIATEVVTIVARDVMMSNALAGSSTGSAKQQARSVAHSVSHSTAIRTSRTAHSPAALTRGPARYNAVRRISIFGGPGYLYVPRKGIVDEACNLPTSACPNEIRDVNSLDAARWCKLLRSCRLRAGKLAEPRTEDRHAQNASGSS
jgi:hypothetical protein